MIPESVWSAQLPAGQHRILLALWDFAHAWREGDGEWFVWPRVATLADKLGLGQRTVHARLAELEAAGWVRRDTAGARLGWRLVPSLKRPQLAAAADPAVEETQLGFSFMDVPAGAANGAELAPVDKPCTSSPSERTPVHGKCTIVQSPPLQEHGSEQKRLAPRSFEDFERQRASARALPRNATTSRLVDGRRVDRWEQEAWSQGGDDAVRQQRALCLSSDTIGQLAETWLRQHRGAS